MRAAELSFVIIVAVMVAFYLIFILPAQREQRRVHRDIQNLRVGDAVVTTSGFLARVKEITIPEEGPVQLVLDLGGGTEVRALTSAIARRLTAEPEATAEEERKGA